MSAYALPPRRESRLPSFLAAAALHLAVFLAVTQFVHPKPLLPAGGSVPINIVSDQPAAESRPTEAAPQTEIAATEAPVPDAPPLPPPPAAPAAAAPPPPSPLAAKAAPSPQALAAPSAKPAKPFSLDALEASIARAAKSAPRPSSAARGPARPATAPEARSGAGVALSQADQRALAGLIKDYWHPNCEVDGGDTVIFDVVMTLGPDGRAERVDAKGLERSGDPVKAAAAIRARSAAYQFAPLVPANLYGQVFTITFNAKNACAGN